MSSIRTPFPVHDLPSPNFDERASAHIDILLLHYTGMPTAEGALARLRDPQAKVSSHYLVHENGGIVRLVDETHRAWHAGVSRWHGWTDINSRSIGIEIVNPGHDAGCPPFPDRQIEAVIALCRDIIGRWPIPPDQVLAHSDVAPLRKQDPGEIFPWRRLAEEGVGLWVEPAPVAADAPPLSASEQHAFLHALASYGYGFGHHVNEDGRSEEARAAVTAFQRHFRPARVDGEVDRSSDMTLRRLSAARDAGR